MRPSLARVPALGLALGSLASALAAPDLPSVDYPIKTGEFTRDRRHVISPYAPDERPFTYLDRIQPPPPKPPRYLVLDKYTPKFFFLPPLAPTLYKNGDRYSFTPAGGWNDRSFDDGMRGNQFLNIGISYARYMPEAIARPIFLPMGDADERLSRYDPTARPEFLLTEGYQSADVYKSIDKTSEAGFPVYGSPSGNKVHRTSIDYSKISMAWKGLALTGTFLESTESLRPRKSTGDALAAGVATLQGELAAVTRAATAAGVPVEAVLASGLGGQAAKDILEAERLLGPKAAAAARNGQIAEKDLLKAQSLLLRKAPPAQKYQEFDVGLNYSHELIPRHLDGTVGYTAYFIPETGFWGTGFASEFYAKLAVKSIPHMRPNVTFSLFNSAAVQLRGRFVDFRWETYDLTVFNSARLATRVELNPYVSIGLDDDLIGDNVGWSAFCFGVRAPVSIGKHVVINLDLNYGIPINGHADSDTNFRTDLGEVGPWGGVSLSYRF